MATGGTEPQAALREELREVDDELARQRADLDDLRKELGDPSEQPVEPEDRANLLTELETQEAVIETLEARRADLLKRLGEA
jgi:hypothetical protein